LRSHWLLAGSILAFVGYTAPASAQRVDNNATTQAEDAFGKSVGDESIGIYNAGDVRGFSPLDAGNVRIEGLYFDQQTGLTDRVSDSSTIRVGLSAQSYPFPAPTGIADFSIRRPGKKAMASIALIAAPWNSKEVDVDLQLPIDGDRLGFIGGGALVRGSEQYDVTYPYQSAAAALRWAPLPGTEIVPFWSYSQFHGDLSQPLVFTSGAFLPQRFARRDFLGQRWADNAGRRANYGLLARSQIAGFDIHAGLFRSVNNIDKSTADLMFGTNPNGLSADRLIVVENGDRTASTSGELRVQRGLVEGHRQHMLIASVRGRMLDRDYGGADLIDLGASRTTSPDYRAVTPAIQAILDNNSRNPKTRDRVRQATFGLAYQGKWDNVGELTLGLQKTRYTKRITDPNPAILLPESRANPWLPSVTAAVYLSKRLAAYGSFTRGLEESPVAPSNASNLNEAPPAIRTEQKDAGLRWIVKPGLTAIAGVFDISKPYFNIDGTNRFRQLGMVRNRGVEFSIAGEVFKGFSIVVGNVLIDARVSGEEVDRGLIGSKPVGTFVRHTIGSVNYVLPFLPALSVDAFTEATSSRVADTANSYSIPARAVVHLGARYRFDAGKAKLLLRGQVQNVTNTFGWSNGGSGYFVPNGTRRYLLELAADI